jgi:hypothetical protein
VKRVAGPVVTATLATLAAAPFLCGCGTSFDPASLVESVRILAVAADHPYAAPGATVTLTALAVDGRAQQPASMGVWWVPVVCPNPPGGSYFACYPFFGEQLSPGVDLTSKLVSGPTFSFEMPPDIITSHAAPKSGTPYGMVTAFVIACAGHVQYVDRGDATVPPAPPLGCFDDTGTELGPNDSVFAYAQVFSFADGRTNANPAKLALTKDGANVDPTAGITLSACPTGTKCATTDINTVVPSSSWELDPGDLSVTGAPLHEEIWVDYFVTAGSIGNSALLYDATAGALSSTSTVQKLTAPATAGAQMLWAVVRDNRGGVAWLPVPLTVTP